MSDDKFNVVDSVAREKADRAIAAIDQLRNEISEGFSKVFRRFDEDQRSIIQSSGARLGILITTAIGIVALTFSFTTIITQPLRDNITQLTKIQLDRLQNLPDDYERFGSQHSAIQTNSSSINSIHSELYNNNKDTWKMMGKLEMIQKQVNDVDARGSRRWNDRDSGP